jgi:hypothetical protein
MLSFYGAARGIVLFRKYASRYLAPYALTGEIRQAMMTRETKEEFLQLLDQVIASPITSS